MTRLLAGHDAAWRTTGLLARELAPAVQDIQLYESTRELAENLDAAMPRRAVIEQAQDILMTRRRCDAGQAVSLLAAASQRSNRTLRDIAQAIVEGVSAGPGGHRQDRGSHPSSTRWPHRSARAGASTVRRPPGEKSPAPAPTHPRTPACSTRPEQDIT